MIPMNFPAKRMLEITQISKKPSLFCSNMREGKDQNGGSTPIMMLTKMTYLITARRVDQKEVRYLVW
jgi:hypothetical protein